MRKLLDEHVEQLRSMQQLHYSTNRHALLVILQAMDAAGKDGVIRHVMSGVNPQGCQVFSFKPPSAQRPTHRFGNRARSVQTTQDELPQGERKTSPGIARDPQGTRKVSRAKKTRQDVASNIGVGDIRMLLVTS
ncbi:MAG TPA: hypothetical protein VIY90_17490 [Steroidobacteraceae bacterium]